MLGESVTLALTIKNDGDIPLKDLEISVIYERPDGSTNDITDDFYIANRELDVGITTTIYGGFIVIESDMFGTSLTLKGTVKATLNDDSQRNITANIPELEVKIMKV
mgnify:CR=1 FL=1